MGYASKYLKAEISNNKVINEMDASEIIEHAEMLYRKYRHTDNMPSEVLIELRICERNYLSITGKELKVHLDKA